MRVCDVHSQSNSHQKPMEVYCYRVFGAQIILFMQNTESNEEINTIRHLDYMKTDFFLREKYKMER